MKEDTHLQPSEELAPFFANRREESPLLATTDVEKLLSERAMLPLIGNHHTLRRIIMSISGLAGIAALIYFTGFHQPAAPPVKKIDSKNEPIASKSIEPIPSTTSSQEEKSVTPTITEAPSHGPWSAPGNQYYADLTPEELGKLGIRIVGDTTFAYKLNDNDSVAGAMLYTTVIPGVKYKGHGISSGSLTARAPEGITAQRFYPHLMTFANGMGAAYRIEEGKSLEFGLTTKDNVENDLRMWLSKPAVHGYYAIGYQHSFSFQDNNTNTRRDSIKIMIGKDLPLPRFMPLMTPPVRGYPDSVSHALRDLTLYYDGSNSQKPNITWPASLCIKVDTVTAQDMIAEMDREQNSTTIQKLHSIMARVNELVPVIVRMTPGHGKPVNGDYIFWYEPSEELLNALPPKQAGIFRNKKAPQCMNAPAAVTSSAEVTYCVEQPQDVLVQVIDLTGHVVMTLHQHAESGDNIAKVSTESLPSGMYIISVQNNDGTQRTRRIWVQNAHPKQ
jgi:hypothetical protein